MLEEVAHRGAGVTAKEVVRASGIPSATTYRLLNILVAEGYLLRMPDLHGFALGQKVNDLVGGAAAPPTVCYAARTTLNELRSRIRFGVHLVLYGATSIRVADSDPDHPFTSAALITRYLHASAIGRIYLAEQIDWRAIWPEAWLRAATDRTTTNPAAIDAVLRDVRARGYARQSGELRTDTACLAVPVRSHSAGLVAAIALSAPVDRAEALEPLVDAVHACAHILGPLVS
ncbi:MAG: helix-turn-helix domain-containing protein [Actinomycetota bacterium]|nr:helix-turn-helix domain-containing protein [Actinomycetota bacterium]